MEKQSLQQLYVFKSGDLRKKANNLQPQKPVHLSIVTQFYPPDYAPTGQLIEELAKNLGQQGFRVSVFSGQPGYAFSKGSAPGIEQTDRLQVRRSRTAQLWPQRIRGKALNGLLFCLRSGLHLLRAAGRGDLLLLTTAPAFLPMLGYLVHLCFGSPYVCLLYDIYPDIAVELDVVPAQHWLVRFWDGLNRRVWRQAEAVIVLSSTSKQRLIQKCPEVVDRVSVIHNWADPERIVPIAKAQNWFAQQQELVQPFTVLYSGNMGRCHDLATVMAAAVQLQHEPIEFVFIGGGAKRRDCLQQATRLGLRNCRFLPYQERQDLPYSLTACDLSLVSMSVGMEGLVAPSKLYSALAAGRPIAAICEPGSYLRPLLAEAGCGAAFDNGDSQGLAEFIRALAADPDRAKRLGEAGRQYLLSHFTPELIAQEYSTVLLQAVRNEVGVKLPRVAYPKFQPDP